MHYQNTKYILNFSLFLKTDWISKKPWFHNGELHNTARFGAKSRVPHSPLYFSFPERNTTAKNSAVPLQRGVGVIQCKSWLGYKWRLIKNDVGIRYSDMLYLKLQFLRLWVAALFGFHNSKQESQKCSQK